MPLHTQRDEFTGEELYTLRSENYFLGELELDDEELAALTTALFMLEGQFAYAEPCGWRCRTSRSGGRASRCRRARPRTA